MIITYFSLVSISFFKIQIFFFHSTIHLDLKNAGGNYIDKEVVVDGNLVTSKIPDGLPAFCKSTLEFIKVYNK